MRFYGVFVISGIVALCMLMFILSGCVSDSNDKNTLAPIIETKKDVNCDPTAQVVGDFIKYAAYESVTGKIKNLIFQSKITVGPALSYIEARQKYFDVLLNNYNDLYDLCVANYFGYESNCISYLNYYFSLNDKVTYEIVSIKSIYSSEDICKVDLKLQINEGNKSKIYDSTYKLKDSLSGWQITDYILDDGNYVSQIDNFYFIANYDNILEADYLKAKNIVEDECFLYDFNLQGDSEKQQSCYIGKYYGVAKEPEDCDPIVGEAQFGTCLSYVAEIKNTDLVCNHNNRHYMAVGFADEINTKDVCLYSYSFKANSASYCNKIENEQLKSACLKEWGS
ncbi:MAG: hypothetical protein PHH82_02730 [Candidatus ainarchaeum sp.]|nr:hypothetical protein [Candidatus ainarchaeum sp.]